VVGEPAELTGQRAKDGAGGLAQDRRDLLKYYGTVSMASAMNTQSDSR